MLLRFTDTEQGQNTVSGGQKKAGNVSHDKSPAIVLNYELKNTYLTLYFARKRAFTSSAVNCSACFFFFA
jgi:hypothetical protein